MPSFKFGQQTQGNVFSRDSGGARAASRQRTPIHGSSPVGSPFSNSGSNSGPRQPGYQVDRFNPAYDRLEEGSVIEDWIPRDLPGINKMLRIIYLRDQICGPAVDIMSNLPWSEFDLQGVDDPEIMKFYEDAAQIYGSAAEEMPAITTEYLSLGRFCASMIYNEEKGYWDDFVAHDSDFLQITPIPVRGFEPKIDLLLSPGVRQFANSPDYRDRAALDRLPLDLVAKMRSGQPIPLDPLNTLYVARKTSPYDHVGTSIFTRIIPFWALEKALMNATVTAARRRAGNILHLSIGLDDRWEPSQQEMEDIAGLFIQADEDPVGAVVATRTGVEANEIRDIAGSLWKWSDEWSTFAEGKMRGLGISEALLAGDATYNNMEQARSVFTEQIRVLRTHLTSQIYYKQFKILARAHGFRKKKQADNDHRVRTGRKPDEEKKVHEQLTNRDAFNLQDLSQEDAFEIPDDDLITPTVHWRKSLLPEGDREYLELLELVEEHDMPIPLKIWAARAGYDLNEAMGMLDEDVKIRRRIKEYKSQLSGGEGDFEAGASNFWDASDRFLELRKPEAQKCMQELVNIVHQPGKKEVLADADFIQRHVSQHVDGNQRKRELLNYMLMRLGIATSLPISRETLRDIAAYTATREDFSEGQRMGELQFIARAGSETKNVSDKALENLAASTLKVISSADGPLSANIQGALRSPEVAPSAPTLMSGSTT